MVSRGKSASRVSGPAAVAPPGAGPERNRLGRSGAGAAAAAAGRVNPVSRQRAYGRNAPSRQPSAAAAPVNIPDSRLRRRKPDSPGADQAVGVASQLRIRDRPRRLEASVPGRAEPVDDSSGAASPVATQGAAAPLVVKRRGRPPKAIKVGSEAPSTADGIKLRAPNGATQAVALKRKPGRPPKVKPAPPSDAPEAPKAVNSNPAELPKRKPGRPPKLKPVPPSGPPEAPKAVASGPADSPTRRSRRPPKGSSPAPEAAKPMKAAAVLVNTRGRGRPPKAPKTAAADGGGSAQLVGTSAEVPAVKLAPVRPSKLRPRPMAAAAAALVGAPSGTGAAVDPVRRCGRPSKQRVASAGAVDYTVPPAAKAEARGVPPAKRTRSNAVTNEEPAPPAASTGGPSTSRQGPEVSSPLKRGRGRPPKILPMAAPAPAPGSSAPVGVLRKRGRPPRQQPAPADSKRSDTSADEEAPAAKRRRGRAPMPKSAGGVAAVVAAPAARKRDRPPKPHEQLDAAEPTRVLKRHRGRLPIQKPTAIAAAAVAMPMQRKSVRLSQALSALATATGSPQAALDVGQAVMAGASKPAARKPGRPRKQSLPEGSTAAGTAAGPSGATPPTVLPRRPGRPARTAQQTKLELKGSSAAGTDPAPASSPALLGPRGGITKKATASPRTRRRRSARAQKLRAIAAARHSLVNRRRIV